MHHHSESAAAGVALVFAAPFVVAALLYGGGVVVQRRQARPWPWHRSLAWLAGLAAAATGFLAPLLDHTPQGFVAHMRLHLVVGMLAPVLLVIAAPVTLALRSLHVRRARQVSRLLRSRLAGVLAVPAVAAGLNIGGMWALYFTDMYDLMQRSHLAHIAVMSHILLAGMLFTGVIIPFDPSPHRAGYATRMGILVAALAAHNVLAKLLYASPPVGVTAADGRSGAVLMYYGGDLVAALIITILCAQWYRQAGRRMLREPADLGAPSYRTRLRRAQPPWASSTAG